MFVLGEVHASANARTGRMHYEPTVGSASRTERMWGEITEVDEDLGCYTGSVANDPHHSAAALGDELRFQPHHIAEILKKRRRK